MAHLPESSFFAHQKKIFAYILSFTITAGLVQQPDKIVVRFAHTIYPYSLGSERETQDGWGAAGIEWSRDFHCLLGLGCPKQAFSENSDSPQFVVNRNRSVSLLKGMFV